MSNVRRAFMDLFAVESKVNLAGIDFSSIAINLLQLKKTSKGYLLEHYSMLNLAKGVISNGKVVEAEQFSQVLSKLIQTSHCSASSSALALAGNQALTKEYTLMHKLNDFELQQKVSIKERELFKGSSSKFYSDYTQTSSVDANNNLMYKLAIIAVHKKTVKPLLESTTKAKLPAKVLDLDHYALARTIELVRSQLPDNYSDMNIALVNLGLHSFTLVVIHKNTIKFNKRVDFNNPSIESHIRSKLMKKDTKNIPAISAEDKEIIMIQFNKLIAAFKDTYRSQNIDQMLLSGEVALIDDIDKEIKEKTTVETKKSNPFVNMSFSKDIDQSGLKEISPLFVISCGLAMREGSND